MSNLGKWLIIGALVAPALVLAQTNTGTTSPLRPGSMIKDAAKERVELWRNTLEQKRASTTDAIKQKREEIKNTFTEQREAILKTITERREEIKQLFEHKRASTTEMLRQKREALTDEVKKRRAEILEHYYQKVADLFQNRINRLSEIADHLAERIVMLEDKHGVDLSEATAHLGSAEELLETAAAKADDFSDKALEAVEPGTATEEMKALRAEVWEAIKAAHEALVQAIRAVKAALPPPASNEEES